MDRTKTYTEVRLYISVDVLDKNCKEMSPQVKIQNSGNVSE